MITDQSIEKMSVVEKLALMERLWADLSRQSEDVPSPQWHGTILAERLAAVREGRTDFVDWEVAKRRLRDRHE
jgi:putative addiction module component (TIGR02574 family)